MSLMIIAMTGILLGFLCVLVGFFMEGTEDRAVEGAEKKPRAHRKRILGTRKRAA